jgi:hypothetical protein
MPKGRPTEATAPQPSPQDAEATGQRARIGLLIVALLIAGVAVIAADFVFGTIFGTGDSPTPSPTASAAHSSRLGSGLVLILPR